MWFLFFGSSGFKLQSGKQQKTYSLLVIEKKFPIVCEQTSEELELKKKKQKKKLAFIIEEIRLLLLINFVIIEFV